MKRKSLACLIYSCILFLFQAPAGANSFSRGDRDPVGLPGGPDPAPPGVFEDDPFPAGRAVPADAELAKILARRRVVIIGETHEDDGFRKGLTALLPRLKEGGLTYLAIEAPRDWQRFIDRYQYGGDIKGLNEMSWYLTSSDSPFKIEFSKRSTKIWVDLLKAAADQGIRITFIDMADKGKDELRRSSTDHDFYLKRAEYMAERIAEIWTHNLDGKTVALVGAMHAHKSRIPSFLRRRNPRIDSFAIKGRSWRDAAARSGMFYKPSRDRHYDAYLVYIPHEQSFMPPERTRLRNWDAITPRIEDVLKGRP
ncbi:MAG: hypothetical protein HY921_05585 [Elusimicrobia bacterium]|nr:hypothetical protein [Elusimicrobiota bacterium]